MRLHNHRARLHRRGRDATEPEDATDDDRRRSDRLVDLRRAVHNSERHVARLAAIGGTSVAVLGGFAFSTAVLVAAEPATGWNEAALALFGAAVAAFAISIIWIARASQYQATPDERLMRRPEAKADPAVLEAVRRAQRQDEWLIDLYSVRIAWSTTIGVVTTLLGACTVLGLRPARLGSRLSRSPRSCWRSSWSSWTSSAGEVLPCSPDRTTGRSAGGRRHR